MQLSTAKPRSAPPSRTVNLMASMLPPEVVDYDCDPPWLRWPEMTAHARSMVWGIDSAQIRLVACWSGFWDNETNGYDAAAGQG